MIKLRLYLIRLLAGKLFILMNATIYGDVWSESGAVGIVHGCTFCLWEDRPKLWADKLAWGERVWLNCPEAMKERMNDV